MVGAGRYYRQELRATMIPEQTHAGKKLRSTVLHQQKQKDQGLMEVLSGLCQD